MSLRLKFRLWLYGRRYARATAAWEKAWKPFSFRHGCPSVAKRAFVSGYFAARGWK